MTVSSPVNSVTYTGNDATTIFSYNFEIRVAENAVVILTDITDPSDPIAVTLVAAQYTLTGVGEEAGGTVTYPLVGSPITTNQRITIQSIEPFTQEVDLVNQDGFYPSVVEGALDKLTRMCQQLDEQFSRAVLVPIGSTQDVDLSELIDAINTAAAALAGATGVLTPCTATGTNTIALTPVSGGAHAAYINQELFSFVAANTTTGVVTANVSGLGAKKVYLQTGVQASTDDIVTGVLYLVSYVAALDSANGGFYLFGTGAVTHARFPTQAQATILGRGYGAGTGVPSALTSAQTKAVVGPQDAFFTGTLAVSVAASALTVAVKTLAGADPSVTDPVFVTFSDGAGGLVTRAITAATSVVVSSGSTLGTTNSVAFRLWVVAFDDAGTVRLGIVNCTMTDGIYVLDEWNTESSSAEGGAGAADLGGNIYTGTAVSAKWFRLLGHLNYPSGLGTAGTWSAGPTTTVLYAPGMKRPGDVVQVRENTVSAFAGVSTTIPFDDTIPQQATEGLLVLSQVIVPTGAMNRLAIEAVVMFSAGAAVTVTLALFQDATANAIAATTISADTIDRGCQGVLRHLMRAGIAATTTFKIHMGPAGAAVLSWNGSAGARVFGGVASSNLRVTEFMV